MYMAKYPASNNQYRRQFIAICEQFRFLAYIYIGYPNKTIKWGKPTSNLYYNYEKYPLSPQKPRSLALIEQHLPNISDPVYSVHQSFMWLLWLNWRKSTFSPVNAPNGSKCWPIVTSWIQEPLASDCDVTMTNCSRVVAFLAQWWGQWSQHISWFNFFA